MLPLFTAPKRWKRFLEVGWHVPEEEGPLIPKALNAITEADLGALISNGVAEVRTIDYKRDLPGNSDADRKELWRMSRPRTSAAAASSSAWMRRVGCPRRSPAQARRLDLEVHRFNSIIAAGLSARNWTLDQCGVDSGGLERIDHQG